MTARRAGALEDALNNTFDFFFSLHRLSRFAASQQSLNWGWRRNRSSSQDTNGTFAPGEHLRFLDRLLNALYHRGEHKFTRYEFLVCLPL